MNQRFKIKRLNKIKSMKKINRKLQKTNKIMKNMNKKLINKII